MSSASFISIESSGLIMKTLTLFFASVSFVLTSLGLEIDLRYAALAIGGSFGGSVVLAYYRPERSWFEQTRKVVVSTTTALIVGSVVVKYRGMADAEYIAFTYFVCGTLALIFIRAVISLTESNAATFTTTLVQRVFNIKLDKEKHEDSSHRAAGHHRTRERPRHINLADLEKDGKPITDSQPDEIRVIEQRVIDTKNEK